MQATTCLIALWTSPDCEVHGRKSILAVKIQKKKKRRKRSVWTTDFRCCVALQLGERNCGLSFVAVKRTLNCCRWTFLQTVQPLPIWNKKHMHGIFHSSALSNSWVIADSKSQTQVGNFLVFFTFVFLGSPGGRQMQICTLSVCTATNRCQLSLSLRSFWSLCVRWW